MLEVSSRSLQYREKIGLVDGSRVDVGPDEVRPELLGASSKTMLGLTRHRPELSGTDSRLDGGGT